MSRSCFHGGAFWGAIGDGFDGLERHRGTVNADVLDAWFPPAPGVVSALGEEYDWICRTSPPTHAEGLTRPIAETIGVQEDWVLCGPGSSALMYLMAGRLFCGGSRVLLIEPSYGEYAHLCEHVVGCGFDRFVLAAEEGFGFDGTSWVEKVRLAGCDVAVLVNPSNPCGTTLSQGEIRTLLDQVPRETVLIVDQAYIDYSDEAGCEALVGQYPNLLVLKSLSKGLALSGVRVGYLVGQLVTELKRFAPPWWVSLPAQVAAVRALGDGDYYRGRYEETRQLRARAGNWLEGLGMEVYGSANWHLCRLPEAWPGSAELVRALAGESVFIRDAGVTAPSLGDRWVRIAVKGGVGSGADPVCAGECGVAVGVKQKAPAESQRLLLNINRAARLSCGRSLSNYFRR